MSEEAVETGSSNTDTSSSSEESGVILGGDSATEKPTDAVPAEGAAKEGEEKAASAEGSAEPEAGKEGEDGGDSAAIDPNVVPEGDYQYQLPEGLEVDKGMADQVNPVFKELGLTQGQAQKVIDAYSKHVADSNVAAQNQRNEKFENRLNTWTDELKNDSDFGGENFEKNSGETNEFLKATVPESMQESLFELFNKTGLGSHPDMVRYFHHLSKTFPVGEDSPISGRQSHNPKSRQEAMYPNG